MRTPQESPFDRWRQQAWHVVNEWARTVADDPLPINLQALAAAQKVHAVVFEPLFSDAALERDGDGFVICVNTEAPGVNDKAGTEIELASSDLRTLTPPLRFTIAHELAHLIILEQSGQQSTSDVFRRHSERLERTCNELAGAMLLPRLRLKHEIGGRLLDASHLKDLCATFVVSAETLLLRLGQGDMRDELKGFDGLIVLARGEREAMDITLSLVLEPLGRQKWRHIADSRESLKLEALGLPYNVLRCVCEKERVAEKVQITWRPGMTLPCALTTCRLYSRPLTIMMAIQIIGSLEHVST